MAVFLALRALVIVTPILARSLSSEISGLGAARSQFGRDVWNLLQDPEQDSATLSADLSTRFGYSVLVADHEGPFELRLVQVHWKRDGHMVGGTDDAITTHHFLKLAAGAPAAWVDGTDLPAIEARLVTFLTALMGLYTTHQGISQLRWYRAGPGIAAPNPPVRTTPETLVGTEGAGPCLPPQVAMSVTEKTSDPKGWGRFYLPTGQAGAWVDDYGRFAESTMTTVGDALEDLASGLDSDGTPLVVYSAAKPIRPRKHGDPLPATTARALEITGYQIDDIADVIRSRRWAQPLIRLGEAA